MATDDDDKPLSDEDRRKLIKERSKVRCDITKAYNRFKQGTHVLHQLGRESVLKLAKDLNDIDDALEDDSSSDWNEKIKFMLTTLEEDERRSQERERHAQREERRLEAETRRLMSEEELRAEQLATARAQRQKIESDLAAAANPKPIILKQQTTQAPLEKFTGSPSHYRQWEELFELTIATNDAYETADKFRIFKQLIGTEAAEMIAFLKPDADGLNTARETVRSHFSDPYRVREDVCNQVQKVPVITNRTPIAALRKAVTVFKGGLQILKDSNSGDVFINGNFLHAVATKLPPQMYTAYLRSVNAVKSADKVSIH